GRPRARAPRQPARSDGSPCTDNLREHRGCQCTRPKVLQRSTNLEMTAADGIRRTTVSVRGGMDKAEINTWTRRSRALDLDGLAWDDIPRVPLAPETVRVLRYMQDIESHTVVYVRELLATRVIDDPEVATFLACWFYEETFHGRAL